MVNRFLMLLLLLGWGAAAQSGTATITIDNSWFTDQIDLKDKEIKALKIELEDYKTIIYTKDFSNDNLKDTINELQWYKKYYMHSKHVIGPRIIARIEEMVNNH